MLHHITPLSKGIKIQAPPTSQTIRSITAPDVDVQGISIIAGSVLLVILDKLLALETATDVLVSDLDDPHILEPVIGLLLALTIGVNDVRLGGARFDRERRFSSLRRRGTSVNGMGTLYH